MQLLTSVAVTVKENGPDAVGIPDNKPPVESVTPAGNAPAVTWNVTGAMLPVVVICCE